MLTTCLYIQIDKCIVREQYNWKLPLVSVHLKTGKQLDIIKINFRFLYIRGLDIVSSVLQPFIHKLNEYSTPRWALCNTTYTINEVISFSYNIGKMLQFLFTRNINLRLYGRRKAASIWFLFPVLYINIYTLLARLPIVCIYGNTGMYAFNCSIGYCIPYEKYIV